MRKKVIACFAAFILMSSWAGLAQESNHIKHRVNRGETISKIARDYGISVSELLQHNPDAKSGIRENQFILIPGKEPVKSVQKAVQAEPLAVGKTHVVEPKETIYSLTRKFKISVKDIYTWNPGLKQNGLKVGETIYVSEEPSITKLQKEFANKNTEGKKPVAETSDVLLKKVAPKETLYGIAKLYQTSVKAIVALNPELENRELKVGETIRVPSGSLKGIGTMETQQVLAKANGTLVVVTVKPKETIYSITKQYDISAEELLKLNPDLRYGLKTGMELTVPLNTSDGFGNQMLLDSQVTSSENLSVRMVDFEKSIVKNSSKELAFLLPFNVANIGSDVDRKLQGDSFLNMTLDFYAGSLLAIQEAKKLGLPLHVKVYDSNETKSSSSIEQLLSENALGNSDVIIGPFFQNNVNLLTKRLQGSDVVLVSPLSNEKAITQSSTVIQTMPHADILKSALLDHFIAQRSNITVVVDDKKTSTKNFLKQNYPNLRVLNSSAAKTLGGYFVQGTTNVVILDTNSIETALETTNLLLSQKEAFQVQLASFDRGDVFDYGEITIEKLVDLKLTYPSVTRENETANATAFAKEYKAQNNIYPSRFATRGYDVTWDVILRMFQDQGILATMDLGSQQIENKFKYIKNSNGVIRNTGVYIVQYGEDLTLKVL